MEATHTGCYHDALDATWLKHADTLDALRTELAKRANDVERGYVGESSATRRRERVARACRLAADAGYTVADVYAELALLIEGLTD